MSGQSSKVRVLISIVLVIVIAGVGVSAFKYLKSLKKDVQRGETQTPLTGVNVLALKAEDYQEEFRGYGRVRALLETTVSAETAGVVVEVSPQLEAGAAVEAGSVVVRIDDRDYREALGRQQATLEINQTEARRQKADIASLERQLVVAKNELTLSGAELQRRIDMRKNNVGSPDDVDRQRRAMKAIELNVLRIENSLQTGRINVARIESQIKSTKLDIQRAQRDIERCVLKAPFAGVVRQRTVQLGARVAPGAELYQLVDTSRVEIPISLPASYYGDVKVGAEAKLFQGDDVEPRWTAPVARIAPNVQANDRTFLVYVELKSTDDQPAPPPGGFLKARITGPVRNNVFVLPRTAFLGDRVFVLTEKAGKEGRVKSIEVVVNRLLPDVALSIDPQCDGQRVILDNLEQIASGSRVQVLNEDSKSEKVAAK